MKQSSATLEELAEIEESGTFYNPLPADIEREITLALDQSWQLARQRKLVRFEERYNRRLGDYRINLGIPSFSSQISRRGAALKWDFGEPDPYRPHKILKSYITTTFYRLQLEGKIRIDEDKVFAAFNTRLVDGHYKDIHAAFEPNSLEGGTPWKFYGFASKITMQMAYKNARLIRRPDSDWLTPSAAG